MTPRLKMRILKATRENFELRYADYLAGHTCQHGIAARGDEYPCEYCDWGMSNSEAMYHFAAQTIRKYAHTLRELRGATETLNLVADNRLGLGIYLTRSEKSELTAITDKLYDFISEVRA